MCKCFGALLRFGAFTFDDGVPNILSRLALILAIHGCVNPCSDALYIIAVVCSSWSAVNLSTSKRDVLTPYGDISLASVRSGNCMVARPWGLK